ncbi:hypothetical protein C8R48DRAFT_662848 [Suillus tomentosus]|nr:hypothetical protein C8R48DRAFT_662848 [Suillus tomentosus]
MMMPPPPPKPLPALLSRGSPWFTAADVGVVEDWSHLNKQRQRTRKEKVGCDLTWIWTLRATKREAVREAFVASYIH